MMNDVGDFISLFSFQEYLILGSALFIILMGILSIYRYQRLGERSTLLIRHLTGFLVGLLDQVCMIFFGFQESFLLTVMIFNYAAYGLWFLGMPRFETHPHTKRLILVWILFSAAINTLFEHFSLFLLIGGLPYPIEPLVWTSAHTVLFYLTMHSIGVGAILKLKKLLRSCDKAYRAKLSPSTL